MHDEFIEWANKQSELSGQTIRFWRPAFDMLERNRLNLKPELYRFVRKEMIEETLVRDLNQFTNMTGEMIRMRSSGLDDGTVLARLTTHCSTMQQNFLDKLLEFKELAEKLTGEQLINL